MDFLIKTRSAGVSGCRSIGKASEDFVVPLNLYVEPIRVARIRPSRAQDTVSVLSTNR